MNFIFLGNTTMQWISAGSVAVSLTLVLCFMQSVLVRRLRAVAARTSTGLDDILVDTLSATRVFVMLIIGIYAGSTFLTLSGRAELFINRTVICAALVQAAIWGDRAVRAWLLQYRSSARADPGRSTSTAALGFIARVAVWVVVLLMMLDNLGVNITTLVASLGIGGIAVALAVQNILGDLFASLSIVLDKPFVIGDFITVDSVAGTVEYVGLKTTRVRSLDGEEIIFSNTDLLKSRIHNLKRMESRRVAFQLGITYGTAEEQVSAVPQLLASIVGAQKQVRFDRAHFSGFGPSSLDFEVVYIVNSADYAVHMDVRQAIFLDIYRTFRERGIEFAFPTQTLHVVHAGEGEAVRDDSGQEPPSRFKPERFRRM